MENELSKQAADSSTPSKEVPTATPKKTPKQRFMLVTAFSSSSAKDCNSNRSSTNQTKTEPRWMWPLNFPGKKHIAI
jgi:hypothetical protein